MAGNRSPACYIGIAIPVLIVVLAFGIGQLARYREHNPVSPVQYNWDGKVWFGGTTKTYHSPRTKTELASLVKRAYDQADGRGRIHVVGFGHSWNDIAQAEHLVSLEHMNQLTGAGINLRDKQVTVQAGMQLRDLQKLVFTHGLSFPNMPSVDEQTIGGVVATATHGTGLTFDNLSNRIASIEMVNGKGELVSFTKNSPSDEFNGVRVSLGALGIITELTLQLVDAFVLHETQGPIPMQNWAAPVSSSTTNNMTGLLQYARDNQHIKMWMEIHTGAAQLFRANRAPPPAGGKDGKSLAELRPMAVPRWLDDPQKVLMEIIQYILSFEPFTGAFKYFLPTIVRNFMPVVDRIDVPSEVFVIPHYLSPHQETEWNIEWSQCTRVLTDVQKWVHAHQFPVNHMIEVRFVARDGIWLSPNYELESCHITLLQCNGDARVAEYFRAFQDILWAGITDTQNVGPYGIARPHWAKTFYITDSVQKSRLTKQYPAWSKFDALRRKMDPKGIFRNPWLERIFDY